MKNKVDDVLFTLLKAKDDISNLNVKIDDNVFEELISGFEQVITNYTINAKMSNKELLDSVLEFYGTKRDLTFFEKLNNIRPSKLIKRVKNKIIENNKKKELKKEYEDEIINMVKDKLGNMINQDILENQKRKNENINSLEQSKDISMNENKIPIYNKENAINLINNDKCQDSLIYQDKDKYCVFRNIGTSKSETLKLDNLNQAIICAVDKNISANEININFDKHKNNYGNLASLVIDKRNANPNIDILKEKNM